MLLFTQISRHVLLEVFFSPVGITLGGNAENHLEFVTRYWLFYGSFLAEVPFDHALNTLLFDDTWESNYLFW